MVIFNKFFTNQLNEIIISKIDTLQGTIQILNEQAFLSYNSQKYECYNFENIIASLQKGPDIEKKLTFLLILTEQVMTNR